MATATKPRVIESETLNGQYDMGCCQAIIDHPSRGRLLLREGFGGMDELSGGAYRWRHGWVIRLLSDDTLASLRQDHPDYLGDSILDVAMRFDDPLRPVLGWDGVVIDRLAKSVGL